MKDIDFKEHYKNRYMVQTKVVPLNVLMYDIFEKMKPESVFEFGCNCGKNLDELQKRGLKDLHGIDINKRALEYGKDNFDVGLSYGDETFLKAIPDNKYDLVFTCSVLCHMLDIEDTLKQLRRIGKRLIVVETHETPKNRIYFVNHDYKDFSKIGEMTTTTAHYIIYKDDILRNSVG